MKWFRHKLRKNRIFILTLLSVNVFHMVDGRQFVYAHQVHQQKEERLKEISELLDIPVEKLRPDHDSLFESLQKVLGVAPEDPVKAAGLERLQEVLRKHEEQLAANPYLPQIEAVKNEHQIHRIGGMIQDLMQLTQPVKALPEGAQKAILRNLHHGLSQRVELPPLAEGLPAKAQARHAEMQAKLDRMFDLVRPIIASTQDGETMQGTVAQKVEQLRLYQGVETKRASRSPRFVDRPLPLRRVEKKARTLEVSAIGLHKASAQSSASATTALPPSQKVLKDSIAPEIVELAESLGNSPARIFAWAHDNVGFDPKWGAFKGPVGTLWEQSGTSWDQAWLLQQLLQAAGVDARFEWGEIEVSTELLTNITGLDDPWRAGDLLTTAGVPIVLLVQGSQVVGARMSHVWVKAFVDYIPNRGVTPGAGDTWIRMDPSLKRYSYADGIAIHDQVQFSLGAYLESGTALSPRRAYEDALWAHIRANDIVCTTLEQLKPAGSVLEESFPFLPGTLRGKVTGVDGEASDLPGAFRQRLQLEVRAAAGTTLVTWQSELPALAGERLELAWQGATADDQATLDSYGGVFETPPYLVDLMPVVKVGGLQQAVGGGIGSAEDVEIHVTLAPASGPAEVLVHRGYAGEPSVVVTDFGHIPQQIFGRHQEALAAAATGGDAGEVEVATLQLLGATYFHNLGRDLEDLAGWSWHRLVRLVSEGMVVQTGDVTTTAGGDPLTFTRGERFIDMAGLTLGLFDTDGQEAHLKPTLELAGAHASFLEGQVFDQVVAREGISAVVALTLAQREGQSLTLVDGGNVDAVLAAVDLGADVEAQVAAAVAQGKVAWVPESEVEANLWQGTGYILEDPANGAAAYLLSGGFAGGADTGEASDFADELGDESWLSDGFLGVLSARIRRAFGGGHGDGPETNQGDPINLASGNLWFSETDLTVLGRGLPIFWTRTYNSRSDYEGPLGHGWTFSYGEHLEQNPDASVLYREDDGTENLFTRDPGGRFSAPPGKHLTLTESPDGFALRTKEGLISRFDSSGRLISIADRNDNTVTLSYDASGGLSSISDASGRVVLSVTQVAGRITEVEDLAGNRVLYEHIGGDLTTVDSAGEAWAFCYDSEHNLSCRRNPLGEEDSYAYDTLDRCVQHVDPLGHTEDFLYSNRGESAVVKNKHGFSSFYELDERGRAVLEVDPLGNALGSSWDADNNRISTIDPRGGMTLRTYDERGNLLTERDPLGYARSFEYDPVYNVLLTTTDENGHTVQQTLDEHGNLEQITETVSGETMTTAFAYDGFGQLIEARQPPDRVTTLIWEPTKGALESQTDPLGNTVILTTNDLGQIVEIEDPLGDRFSLEWTTRGQIASMVDAFDNTTEFVYDAAGRQTESITSRGTVRTEYDPLGRPVAETDQLGKTIRTEYDAAGNVIARVDARGNRSAMTYDAVGRLITTVDPLGNVWGFGYCAEIGGKGNDSTKDWCEFTDPQGATYRRNLDELGRVRQIIDPLGHVTEIDYDAAGRQVRIKNALGNETRYEYDESDSVTEVIQADGSRTEYAYDPVGNLLKVRDSEGRDWLKTYDKLNRLTTDTDPQGQETQFYYSPLGHLERKILPTGEELIYDYERSRLEAIHLPNGAVESFGYDVLGRRTTMANGEVTRSFSYDALNRLSTVVDHTLGRTIEYAYDADGNTTRFGGPKGDVEYYYDAAGRMVEQRDPATGVYRYEYDSVGRRIALNYPNGFSSERAYDASSRLLSVVTRNSEGDVVDGYSYSYNAMGKRMDMAVMHESVQHSYQYDEVGRLKRWQRGQGRFEEYSYDQVGNRLGLVDESGSTSYLYDAANRLLEEVRESSTGGVVSTTNYVWDARGRMTSQTRDSISTGYRWDALDRLVEITAPDSTHTYGYDGDGIRVRETNGASTRRFLHSREDIVASIDGEGDIVTYYSHSPQIDETLAQLDSGGASYLHHDGLFSVTAVSGPNGQIRGAAQYAAFGGLGESEVSLGRFGYTNREADPTGLMYYRSRYYEPGVGRFLSQDAFRGDVFNTASLHRYTYVENDPVNHVDPDGYFPVFYLLAGAAAFVFAAIAFYYAYTLFQEGEREFAGYFAVLGLVMLVVSAGILGSIFPGVIVDGVAVVRLWLAASVRIFAFLSCIVAGVAELAFFGVTPSALRAVGGWIVYIFLIGVVAAICGLFVGIKDPLPGLLE